MNKIDAQVEALYNSFENHYDEMFFFLRGESMGLTPRKPLFFAEYENSLSRIKFNYAFTNFLLKHKFTGFYNYNATDDDDELIIYEYKGSNFYIVKKNDTYIIYMLRSTPSKKLKQFRKMLNKFKVKRCIKKS